VITVLTGGSSRVLRSACWAGRVRSLASSIQMSLLPWCVTERLEMRSRIWLILIDDSSATIWVWVYSGEGKSRVMASALPSFVPP